MIISDPDKKPKQNKMELRILNKEPVTMSDLSDELKKIRKKELKALQQKTNDYALKFSKLNKVREAKFI